MKVCLKCYIPFSFCDVTYLFKAPWRMPILTLILVHVFFLTLFKFGHGFPVCVPNLCSYRENVEIWRYF